MPHYEYDKDYPFAAFITNLGKYNEGSLVGEWVKFPTTAEELQKVFERIGIGSKDDFGQPYEEWFITDYDCYVDGLYDKLGEYESLDELNYLASKLDEMSQGEYEQFQAAMEIGDHSGSLQEIINLTENLDCYDIYPDIHDHDDLGRYYIEELDAMQVPEHLRNYIDYEAYGRDVALEEGGEFTDFGYVRDTGDRFDEVYDGDRDSIPEEYRVMTFQDEEELTQDEKLEMAMDLAFDLDQFFRQQDPQYAAEHPDAHAAKEEMADKLFEGRIAFVEDRLNDMGPEALEQFSQRLEEFKDATGYEEFLDVDPAAIWEVLENPERSHADEMLAFAEQAGREYEAELFGESKEPMKGPEPAPGFHAPQADVDPAVLAEAAEIAGACDDILRNNNLLYDAAIRDTAEVTEMILRGDTDKLKAGLSTLGREEGMASEVAPLISRLEAFEKEHGIGTHEQKALSPDDRETGETVRTPRGTFYVTDMSREQMEAAGYGLHHQSDDGKYLIMGNGDRAFAIRNEEAQEHAAPEKMTVLVVEPRKEPYLKEIAPGLHSLQAEVGGDIAASYPFSDPVGLVCNDEGKLIGLELNRGLRDEDGNLYDIMAGTFLVVGLGEEDFTSLPPELTQKYMEHFKQPEQFINLNGQIIALPVEPENPLRTAEMTVEDDYGMIDGVINNGRKGEELEAAKGEMRRTSPEKKPSIRERLEEAKRECGERKPPDKAHQKKPPEHDL